MTGGVTPIPTPNALRAANGPSVVPFVTVVPQVPGHLHLLNGSDAVIGGPGDDVAIGDDSTVFVPTVTASAELIARARALTEDAHEVTEQWAELAHEIHHAVGIDRDHHGHDHDDHAVVVDRTFAIGQDTVDGDAGMDVVVGDDHTVVAPVVTVAVGQVHDLHHLVHEVDHVDETLAYANGEWDAGQHHRRDGARQVLQGKKWVTVLEHHVDRLLLGSDLLRGGDGNDLMIGDDWSYLAPALTVVPGGTPAAKHDHHWHGDDHDGEHDDHHHHHGYHHDDHDDDHDDDRDDDHDEHHEHWHHDGRRTR